jgi:4-amino-4-deoxy-L-arabinose transferase-like glycosyltransferase
VPLGRALIVVFVGTVVAAHATLLAEDSPAHLTSDESLYLAQAFNIASGEGFTYPSGEPITHRAPLFSAVLAPFVAIGGADAAYVVTRAVVVANVLLVMLLAWRIAGAVAGVVAATATAASAYLNGFGLMLYLDPAQCTLLLLAVLCMWEAMRSHRMRWFVVAGVSTGVAFLMKESAIQWLPLAAAAWLAIPSMRTRGVARGVLAYCAAYGSFIALWCGWVWWTTGELFLLGEPTPAKLAAPVAAVAALVTFAIGIALWPRLPQRARAAGTAAAPAAAIGLLALWFVFIIYGLTAYSTWPYPNDYLHTVPRYLASVVPQAQPFYLLALAWVWAFVYAIRGFERYRLILIVGTLFLPFALVVANRNLQLRDALPLVYLSYVLLGIVTAHAVHMFRRAFPDGYPTVLLLGAAVTLGSAFVLQQGQEFRGASAERPSPVTRADSWNSPFVLALSAWLDANLPSGANILSSRLYFSSLYVHTDGRFAIRQLPTVRVDIDASREAPIEARSNLFRWGDVGLRATQPDDTWLYLGQYPGKQYWVGLSEQELLEYARAHGIEYLVLTGDDVAFSTAAYVDYFLRHPGFSLLYTQEEPPLHHAFVFAVRPELLHRVRHETVVGPHSYRALLAESGLTRDELESRLGTPLRVRDREYGLSPAERSRIRAMTGR